MMLSRAGTAGSRLPNVTSESHDFGQASQSPMSTGNVVSKYVCITTNHASYILGTQCLFGFKACAIGLIVQTWKESSEESCLRSHSQEDGRTAFKPSSI